MLGFELKEAYVTYARSVEQNKPFFDALDVLGKWFGGVKDYLQQLAPGGQGLQSAASSIHSHLHNAGLAKPIRASVFVKSAWNLAGVLRGLFPRTDSETDAKTQAERLADDVEALLELHDTYTAEKSGSNALPFIVAGHDLLLRLTSFGETLKLAAASLNSISPIVGVDEQEFTMHFQSEQSIRSFWEKLRAIEKLYRTLCELFDVSENAYPLRVVKIESGSLWLQLVGSAVVLAFLTKLIWAGFQFVHRNYTAEGRIAGSTTRMRTIRDNMELAKELEAMGIDTSTIRTGLGSAAESITEQLSYVVDNESLIKVNNQTLRAEPTFEPIPRLSNTSLPRLTDGTNKGDGDR